MDAQDKARTLSNREKLLIALKARHVLTNHEARGLGGSRAMGRIHELQKAGHAITVRKIDRSTWEIRYELPALGRDAQTPHDGQRVLPGLGHGSFAR